MPERSSKRPSPEDVDTIASYVLQEAVSEIVPEQPPIKNQAAVALGRLGGLKGGKARALKLEPEQRKEIARLAAVARWSKAKNSEETRHE